MSLTIIEVNDVNDKKIITSYEFRKMSSFISQNELIWTRNILTLIKKTKWIKSTDLPVISLHLCIENTIANQYKVCK